MMGISACVEPEVRLAGGCPKVNNGLEITSQRLARRLRRAGREP
jgi:hypothetical protein